MSGLSGLCSVASAGLGGSAGFGSEAVAGRNSISACNSTALASSRPWMSSITSRARRRCAGRLEGAAACSAMILSISGSGMKVKRRR